MAGAKPTDEGAVKRPPAKRKSTRKASKPAEFTQQVALVAIRDVVAALESGEWLRGEKHSVDAGKSFVAAPYLAQLRAGLRQLQEAAGETPDAN